MDWMVMIFWIAVASAAVFIDISSSSFIFIWFAVGAIAAIIAMVFNASVIVQTMIFISVSAAFMAVGYPLVKKTINKTVKKTLTMEQGYVGNEITLTKDIDVTGNIKFQGIYWTVKNVGKPLKKGDLVQVIGIEGNKLLIGKV
jgi:membrane protein implicated in regulation of membrane protease activity